MGDLFSAGRYAQLLGRYRPMAAWSPAYVYIEMLEAGAHTLQELAKVRHPEVASVAMGEQP